MSSPYAVNICNTYIMYVIQIFVDWIYFLWQLFLELGICLCKENAPNPSHHIRDNAIKGGSNATERGYELTGR